MAKTIKTFTFPNLDTVITAHNKREEHFASIFIDQLTNAVEYMQDKEYSFGQKLKHGTDSGWYWEDLGGQAGALYFMKMIPEPISSVTISRACKQTFNDTASDADKIDEYWI